MGGTLHIRARFVWEGSHRAAPTSLCVCIGVCKRAKSDEVGGGVAPLKGIKVVGWATRPRWRLEVPLTGDGCTALGLAWQYDWVVRAAARDTAFEAGAQTWAQSKGYANQLLFGGARGIAVQIADRRESACDTVQVRSYGGCVDELRIGNFQLTNSSGPRVYA